MQLKRNETVSNIRETASEHRSKMKSRVKYDQRHKAAFCVSAQLEIDNLIRSKKMGRSQMHSHELKVKIRL